jgi:hypothetical protein
MNALLDRLFRLRLAASLLADDSALPEKRMAELRSLLDEIAAPSGNEGSCDDERDERPWLPTSAAV